MSLRHSLHCLTLWVLFTVMAFAQSKPPVHPVADDPLEPITGEVKVLETPADRSLVLGLLERARQNSALHQSGTPPFTIKLSFTASGFEHSGSGETEETFIEFGRGRWTARLGGYSQTRVFSGSAAYDETMAPMPLRLATVRTSVLNPMPGNWSHSLIRFAGGKWNGKDVICALISDFGSSANSPGRRWSESEFCVDPKTGLLQMASQAPGIFASYDYKNAILFHGRSSPAM